ncbi:hypothetical protein ACH6CV_12005 [Bacillota bacterium Meth-B3]
MNKHVPAPRIQLAKLALNTPIRLLDLSMEGKGNLFLRHCRFQFDPTEPVIKRAYLIPNFVGDFCHYTLNYNGIKYYGTKDYTNFVTWSDDHFRFISQEII